MYLISKHSCVSFTDNSSVPQTMDDSVNQGFAKHVSSTDNCFISELVKRIYMKVKWQTIQTSVKFCTLQKNSFDFFCYFLFSMKKGKDQDLYITFCVPVPAVINLPCYCGLAITRQEAAGKRQKWVKKIIILKASNLKLYMHKRPIHI